MRKLVVLAAFVVTACHPSDVAENDNSGKSPPATLQVRSVIPEIRIKLTRILPPNRQAGPVDDYCSPYLVAKPKSAGGRSIVKAGWRVMSETKLGRYDAITFVAKLEPMTSATCVHVDGNLAIYDGTKLAAIAYKPLLSSAQEDDLVNYDGLGVAEQIDGNRIRLRWGLPSPPFADVVLRDGLSVEAIASEDVVCRGRAKVPNVFGKDIWKAREELRAFGWLPEAPTGDEAVNNENMTAHGVLETESCSGTGYAYCAYNYRQKSGIGLRVLSVGEEYRVYSYEPACGG